MESDDYLLEGSIHSEDKVEFSGGSIGDEGTNEDNGSYFPDQDGEEEYEYGGQYEMDASQAVIARNRRGGVYDENNTSKNKRDVIMGQQREQDEEGYCAMDDDLDDVHEEDSLQVLIEIDKRDSILQYDGYCIPRLNERMNE